MTFSWRAVVDHAANQCPRMTPQQKEIYESAVLPSAFPWMPTRSPGNESNDTNECEAEFLLELEQMSMKEKLRKLEEYEVARIGHRMALATAINAVAHGSRREMSGAIEEEEEEGMMDEGQMNPVLTNGSKRGPPITADVGPNSGPSSCSSSCGGGSNGLYNDSGCFNPAVQAAANSPWFSALLVDMLEQTSAGCSTRPSTHQQAAVQRLQASVYPPAAAPAVSAPSSLALGSVGGRDALAETLRPMVSEPFVASSSTGSGGGMSTRATAVSTTGTLLLANSSLVESAQLQSSTAGSTSNTLGVLPRQSSSELLTSTSVGGNIATTKVEKKVRRYAQKVIVNRCHDKLLSERGDAFVQMHRTARVTVKHFQGIGVVPEAPQAAGSPSSRREPGGSARGFGESPPSSFSPTTPRTDFLWIDVVGEFSNPDMRPTLEEIAATYGIQLPLTNIAEQACGLAPKKDSFVGKGAGGARTRESVGSSASHHHHHQKSYHDHSPLNNSKYEEAIKRIADSTTTGGLCYVNAAMFLDREHEYDQDWEANVHQLSKQHIFILHTANTTNSPSANKVLPPTGSRQRKRIMREHGQSLSLALDTYLFSNNSSSKQMSGRAKDANGVTTSRGRVVGSSTSSSSQHHGRDFVQKDIMYFDETRRLIVTVRATDCLSIGRIRTHFVSMFSKLNFNAFVWFILEAMIVNYRRLIDDMYKMMDECESLMAPNSLEGAHKTKSRLYQHYNPDAYKKFSFWEKFKHNIKDVRYWFELSRRLPIDLAVSIMRLLHFAHRNASILQRGIAQLRSSMNTLETILARKSSSSDVGLHVSRQMMLGGDAGGDAAALRRSRNNGNKKKQLAEQRKAVIMDLLDDSSSDSDGMEEEFFAILDQRNLSTTQGKMAASISGELLEKCRNMKSQATALIDLDTSLHANFFDQCLNIDTKLQLFITPMGFLTALSGMNFYNIRFLHWEYAYFGLWAVFFLFAGSLYFMIRRLQSW